MSQPGSDYTQGLARNLVVGLASAYAASAALCYIALGDVGTSLAVSLLPAVFAGPYIAILITLISALRRGPAEATTRPTDGTGATTQVGTRALVLPPAA